MPVVSMIWLWVTPLAASRSGSIWTCSCRSRSPQTATLATPGTPSSLGLMVHRERTDISIRDSFSEDTPIIATRLVADSGWIMTGGFDALGSAYAPVSRSWTICRARIRSVPGRKTMITDESPGIDLERIVWSQGTPATSSSTFSVTRSSTSFADSPRASVWISTYGRRELGENVDRHAPQLPDADDHDHCGGGDHQDPEPQGSLQRFDASWLDTSVWSLVGDLELRPE